MSFPGDNFYCADNDRYERSKIGKLRTEREEIQAKTYKNWINSILIQGRTSIDDIYTDLTDGEKLIILLRLLTGENVGTVNKNSSLLLHKIANVSQCLRFIKSKNVYLESIGPDDIVYGNKTLTLGLIWTLILRFQLSQHLDFEQYDLKSIKESMLLWCCNRTKHLEFVKIVDFHQSWQNGWAFIALVHSFRPESLDIDALRRKESRDLLAIAFDTAYQQLLIPKILDIDDVINEPDENSILTYVSFYYNLYSRTKNSETNVKRIQYFLTNISDVDNMQDSYNNLCRSLLEWIAAKSASFENDVPIDRAQDEMLKFNAYFFNERCEKLKCRNHCETLYFEIISIQKETGIKVFQPAKGLKVKDLEKSWLNLEVIETKRLSKLKNLINKQRKICQQAELFDSKSQKFENYIVSKLELLNNIFMIDKPISLQDLEQHLQQSEAICLDVHDNNMKFDSLITLANELIEQQLHDDSRFYSQYLTHIDDKLKRLHELASSNLTTIELTRHLFTDLTCIENTLNESRDLYGQINSIDISNHHHSIQNIMLNLEKLKYLEIYLIVLEKDYLESKRKFDSIRLDDKYRFCFIIFDIDIYEKKLTDSKSNIVLCRDSIEKIKKVCEYKIHLNEFLTNVECLNQFLNEKLIVTRTDPNDDDCFNSVNIHFIQRRNNIIKLEIKVMEKELYDTCRKGYILINDSNENDIIESMIREKIEKIKNDFKSFIITVNERTLLIHDCITLFNLVDELRQHEELIRNLNENFYENIMEKIELYQNDLQYLGEIFEKIGQLYIRIQRYSLSDDRYIVYLKNYPNFDVNNLESSHKYLIVEMDFPDIHMDKFHTIHCNLFELIRNRIDHIKQLLYGTRSDMDLRKLKQMLNVKINDDGDDVDNRKIIENIPTVEEIDLIFKIFFQQNEHSSLELKETLCERNHLIVSDFHNMNVLSMLIKRTMKLIKSTKDIVDFCQLNRSNIPDKSMFNEIEQQHLVDDEPDHSETIKLVNTVEENVSAAEEDDDDDENVEHEQEQKRMAIIMKKKIFIRKLKNDIIFIYQYFINSNQHGSDWKFKLNFLAKIIENNVRLIEIYIVEHPADDDQDSIIQTLSNELKKCNVEIDEFQKLSTFKDLLDDFYINVNNHLDNLHCIQLADLNDLDEKIVRNDMRTMESIEISYVYYKDLFDEFQRINIGNSDEKFNKYLKDLTLILEKFALTIQSTKELLNKRWKSLQERKKQIRMESFMKRLYQSDSKTERIDSIKDEQQHSILEESENKQEEEDNSAESDDDQQSTKIENLIREIEIILFDINCGINMHRYKSEQIDAIYNEAIELTDDPKILNRLKFYKKEMDLIIKKQTDRLELEDFQMASDYFLTCYKQDIQTINELIGKITGGLPINVEHRQLINGKMMNIKFNQRHYQSLITMIEQNHGNSKQPEICSKMIQLNDSLKELKSKMNNLLDLLNIDEEFESLQSNVEYITIIIEEYNDIDLETLKELRTKTNETIEQIRLFIVDNNKLIEENLLEKEVNNLESSTRRLAIIIRYKIFKYELAKKLKQFENRKCIEDDDDEFQAFIDEIREQQRIMDDTLTASGVDFNSNQTEMFDQILTNMEILLKKLHSFSVFIEIDSHRKLLESNDVIIEPCKNIRPSSKIIKRIINKKPKNITEIKRFTVPKSFDLISDEDIINNNYTTTTTTTPVKYYDNITEEVIKSTTSILHENDDKFSDEDGTKIYEICIELVKDEEPKARQDDEIVETDDVNNKQYEQAEPSTTSHLQNDSISSSKIVDKNDQQQRHQSSKKKKKLKKKSKLREKSFDEKNLKNQINDEPIMNRNEFGKLISEKFLIENPETNCCQYGDTKEFNLNFTYNDDWLDYLTTKISNNVENNDDDDDGGGEKVYENQIEKFPDKKTRTKLKNQTLQQKSDDDENENVTKIEYLPIITKEFSSQSSSIDIINNRNIEREIDDDVDDDSLNVTEFSSFGLEKSPTTSINTLSNFSENILHNENVDKTTSECTGKKFRKNEFSSTMTDENCPKNNEILNKREQEVSLLENVVVPSKFNDNIIIVSDISTPMFKLPSSISNDWLDYLSNDEIRMVTNDDNTECKKENVTKWKNTKKSKKNKKQKMIDVADQNVKIKDDQSSKTAMKNDSIIVTEIEQNIGSSKQARKIDQVDFLLSNKSLNKPPDMVDKFNENVELSHSVHLNNNLIENQDFEDEDDDDSDVLNDLESRIDSITKQIEYIMIQITVWLLDECNDHQPLNIRQLEDLIESRINHQYLLNNNNNKGDGETCYTNDKTQQPLSDVWIDYLTPATSITTSATNEFIELINWNEIENTTCDLKTYSNSDEWMDYLSVQKPKTLRPELQSSIIDIEPVKMKIFDDKKKDLVDNVELSNELIEKIKLSDSLSDIWLDYLSPRKLNSDPDKDNENDLKSKEIEKNDKSNEPSNEFGQIKLTLSSSDDWLDYLSPQVSNDMKFNHDHVNPNIVPSNEITTRPIIMMTESMKNQKSRSKKKSKKHKRNQLSIITDTTDNNEKVAVNHIEPKSSSDSDVLPNQKSFHIHDSSDDWLDYLSVIIVEENKNEKFDLQRSIIDLQPIENDVDRKSHGESVLTISKEMENSLNRIYENNNNNNNGDNRNENNGQQQVEITMKPMSSKNEQNEKIDNDANENEKSQLGPINNVDFRMQVVVDNGDDGNHLKNGIQTLPLSKFSEEIENNNNSNERSFDKEKRRPALGVVDFNKEKDKQRKNQTNAGMNFIENKHAFINDDGKDYSFEINNTVQPSSSKDVKSLNVNDIDDDDDEKSNVRHEEIENPKSSMKRFKRILLNSLPFYLLFLLIFLLFLMLPKDENEFNCLLRNDYYNNEMTLKKMYLHGAPPI